MVLTLLATVAVLIAPRLPSLQQSGLRSSARQLAALMRYLDERAVGSKQTYRLRINLNEQRIDVVRPAPAGEELPPGDPYLQRNPLQEGIRIVSLSTERLGTVTSGTVRIGYGPGGLSEPLTVNLGMADDDTAISVQAFPAGRVVRVRDVQREESR